MAIISISTDCELCILNINGTDVTSIGDYPSDEMMTLLDTIVNGKKAADRKESLHPDIIESLRFTDESEDVVERRHPALEDILKSTDINDSVIADEDTQRVLSILRTSGEPAICSDDDVTAVIYGDWYLIRVEPPQPCVTEGRLINSTIWLICRDDKIRKPPRINSNIIDGLNTLLEKGVNLIRHCNTVY